MNQRGLQAAGAEGQLSLHLQLSHLVPTPQSSFLLPLPPSTFSQIRDLLFITGGGALGVGASYPGSLRPMLFEEGETKRSCPLKDEGRETAGKLTNSEATSPLFLSAEVDPDKLVSDVDSPNTQRQNPSLSYRITKRPHFLFSL